MLCRSGRRLSAYSTSHVWYGRNAKGVTRCTAVSHNIHASYEFLQILICQAACPMWLALSAFP